LRGADAARAEDELDPLSIARRADHARREGGTRLRPGLLPVEAHLVLVGLARLEARDADEGVVVAPDAERGRGAPEHQLRQGSLPLRAAQNLPVDPGRIHKWARTGLRRVR